MPPKRDTNNSINAGNTASITSANATENSSTTTTTTASSAAATQSTAANTTTVAAATASSAATASNNNTSTMTTRASSPQPVIIPDAAAEQRTVAFHANAKLCRLVRKCPWMYDRNHHNYAKKHILDKSWCKIARECNDSVASCKERWRNIRAAFARSINIYKTHSGPNRVKPYYLHKELSFLVKPMMEGRDKNDDTQECSVSDTAAKEDYTEEEEDEEEDDVEEDDVQVAEEEVEEEHDDTADIKSAFEALNPDISIHTEPRYHKTIKTLNPTTINNNYKNQSNEYDSQHAGIFEPHTEFTTSEAENEFNFPDETMSQTEAERRVAHMLNPNITLKRTMQLDTEAFETKRLKLTQIPPHTPEADLRFLEALLPDMALMNTRQKIVFKRKIYQTLEEVFENSNDFPNIIPHQERQIRTPATTTTQASPQTTPHAQHSMTSTTTLQGGAQVKQTVLTVNSSTARSLINNIANLNETDLQKVSGFLQSSLLNVHTSSSNHHNTTTRLTNGVASVSSGAPAPSSAAARLMHSQPKITITKVTCPPPASLRNLAVNKPPSPSSGTVSTTIHHPATPVITSNVHSTTSSTTGNISSNNNTSASSTNANNSSAWTQLMPIAIKDEIEDVDID